MNKSSTPKTSLNEFIHEDLIVLGLDVNDKAEAVHHLAKMMQEKGFVKDSYAAAVLKREESFPTGLHTHDLDVAIPHTDVEHCFKPAIAVAILNSPVEFTEMATLDSFVDAEVVFLLSITNPADQVKWLARLATLFQTPGVLLQLKQMPDEQACSQFLLEELGKEEE